MESQQTSSEHLVSCKFSFTNFGRDAINSNSALCESFLHWPMSSSVRFYEASTMHS